MHPPPPPGRGFKASPFNFDKFILFLFFSTSLVYSAIKDPHRYDVQVSDTTMMTTAPSARTTKKMAYF